VTGSTLVAPALDPTVTAADMVAGHVVLDISCLDRLYLTGYVAKLQTPGRVVYFPLDHHGKPIASGRQPSSAIRGRSARSSGGP
jgi:hypothetical protein